ncbi:MAG: hypothetical protein RLZ10_359 [Bacteroidota bacterium]|jgi:putative membrane protein insertion efficiency factor
MKLIQKISIIPIIFIVKVYQIFLSPILPSVCRYQPTCSHYMIESLRIWGPFKGLYLGVKRILSCHPWGGNGHDPVPNKNKKTA